MQEALGAVGAGCQIESKVCDGDIRKHKGWGKFAQIFALAGVGGRLSLGTRSFGRYLCCWWQRVIGLPWNFNSTAELLLLLAALVDVDFGVAGRLCTTNR